MLNLFDMRFNGFEISKHTKVILGSFALCFLLNLYENIEVLSALTNSIFFVLIILFFEKLYGKLIRRSYIYILLGAIPLFHYNYTPFLKFFLPAFNVLIWLLLKRLNKKTAIILGFFLFSLVYLISDDLISLPFNIHYEKLIFSTKSVYNAIELHQKDALYLPYRLRLFVYNGGVFLYYTLTRSTSFSSLKTFYDLLLLANLYPLIRGLQESFQKYRKRDYLIYLGFFTTLLGMGINKSPDKFNSFMPLAPFFIYLIILGLEKVNIKLYFILIGLSFLLALGPKI